MGRIAQYAKAYQSMVIEMNHDIEQYNSGTKHNRSFTEQYGNDNNAEILQEKIIPGLKFIRMEMKTMKLILKFGELEIT